MQKNEKKYQTTAESSFILKSVAHQNAQFFLCIIFFGMKFFLFLKQKRDKLLAVCGTDSDDETPIMNSQLTIN